MRISTSTLHLDTNAEHLFVRVGRRGNGPGFFLSWRRNLPVRYGERTGRTRYYRWGRLTFTFLPRRTRKATRND